MVHAVLEADPGLIPDLDRSLTTLVRSQPAGGRPLSPDVLHGLMQHHSAAVLKVLAGLLPGLGVDHMVALARAAPPHVAAVLQGFDFAGLANALKADGIEPE